MFKKEEKKKTNLPLYEFQPLLNFVQIQNMNSPSTFFCLFQNQATAMKHFHLHILILVERGYETLGFRFWRSNEEREMERWRPTMARRLWVEASDGMIVGEGLWIWVGGFVHGGRDGGWWLANQR